MKFLLAVWLAGALAGESVSTGVVKPVFSNRRVPHDAAHLTPPATEFPWRLEETFRDGEVVFHRLTFPSPVKSPYACNDTVWCEYMEPRKVGKRPAVVVLHFLNDGSNFVVTRLVTTSLARHGIAALLLKMPYYGERRPRIDMNARLGDLEAWVAAFQQAVQDVRRGLAWLRSRPEVDPERTGIVGISLGALVASLVTSVDADVRRSALILGGGDLNEILWTAPEMDRLRKALAARGKTREDSAAIIAPIEPLRFAAPLPKGTVLMINGRRDRTVPPACVESLARAFENPEVLWFGTTHVGLAIHMGQLLESVAAFIQRPPEAGASPPAGRDARRP